MKTEIDDISWRKIQEATGEDIMDIVAGLGSGRVSWSDTAERIARHCEAAFNEGMNIGSTFGD